MKLQPLKAFGVRPAFKASEDREFHQERFWFCRLFRLHAPQAVVLVLVWVWLCFAFALALSLRSWEGAAQPLRFLPLQKSETRGRTTEAENNEETRTKKDDQS